MRIQPPAYVRQARQWFDDPSPQQADVVDDDERGSPPVQRGDGAQGRRGQLPDTARVARQHLRQIHPRPIGLHRHGRIVALVKSQDTREQCAPFFVESWLDGEFGEHAPLRA